MRNCLLGLATLCFASVALAQFSGRPNDVVIYLFSVKGPAGFQTVSPSSAALFAGVEVKRMASLAKEEFGTDFEAEYRQLYHKDTNDQLMLITQREWMESPHQRTIEAAKVMIVSGMLRLMPPGRAPVDAPVGFYAPFAAGIDFGPVKAVIEEQLLLWTPFNGFPNVVRAPDSYISPLVPPGKIGLDVILEGGSFVQLLPWFSLQRQQPTAGWQQGIDYRLVERDTNLNTTARILRIRPGRTTPLFRLDANTHMVVLSGSVRITPLNGATQVLDRLDYAWVPNGAPVVLANPAPYDGSAR
jgi:hypothetical protein